MLVLILVGGRSIAFTRGVEHAQIYVMRSDGDDLHRLKTCIGSRG